MQVSNFNNVKVYSVTSAKSAIPEWAVNKKKKELKKDSAWTRRIELIQDFGFPEAAIKLKKTRDEEFIIATGVYKPQMRVYDLSEKSMKFDRHQDCENVQFEILSDDWSKTIMLQSDRSIEIHSQFGMHYKTRVPRFGRDLKYHYQTSDALICGSTNEVYILNLDEGRFREPIVTDSVAINTMAINPVHQLMAFGGEDSKLQFYNPNEKRSIGSINFSKILSSVVDYQLDSFPEITSIKFNNDGLTYAVGSSTGQVVLFDLRSSQPITMKDHQYGYKIKSIDFHDKTNNVISADTKTVKVWNKNDGKNYTSIEPSSDINDVLVWENTGMIMVATESTEMQSYYIPSMGQAPKWCNYLDNLTEEMEESKTQVMYDDYKFVTRKELEQLQLEHLIGTNVLSAYMHGFFLDLKLYEKAKAIANPFQYEEYKKKLIKEKIEKKKAQRITQKIKLPKVNPELAAKLMAEKEAQENVISTTALKKKEKLSKALLKDATEENPLGDSRFSNIFQDQDYEINTESAEFQLRHPTLKQKPTNSR